MAGIPFAGDIAMLGLAFTRLYDDLLDDLGGPNLEQRFRELIEHGRFVPTTDTERLLDELYRELERRLGRDRDDPLYAAAATAHAYQARSRLQRDLRTPHTTLMAITRGKGRYGTLTVFALMRPDLRSRERELIMDVGETLQMLDDYADCESDRRAGIRTTATEDLLRLTDVACRLRAVRPHLAGYYGRRAIREFVGVCYLTMWICFINRRLPRVSARLPVRSRKLDSATPPRERPSLSVTTVVRSSPSAVGSPGGGTSPVRLTPDL